MQLGFPTHPRRDPIAEIDWIAGHGFDFVDLFFEPDRGDLAAVDLAAVGRALSRARLPAVGHCAWYLPIGSPLRELRQAAVESANRHAEAFASLGCRVVTIHAHWAPHLFTVDESIDWQTESLQILAAKARQLGIRFVYEPVGMAQESLPNLRRLFAANPEIGFHLDIGHFNLHGRWPGDFARAFADRLGHVHLHDNDGQRDLHLPPGAGCIEWSRLIPELRAVYDGTITLEVFAPEPEYVLLAQRLVRQWWGQQ